MNSKIQLFHLFKNSSEKSQIIFHARVLPGIENHSSCKNEMHFVSKSYRFLVCVF